MDSLRVFKKSSSAFKSGKITKYHQRTFCNKMESILAHLIVLQWNTENCWLLRAATRKYHLQLCKIEKSKILKFCHNFEDFRSLITEILVSVHSRKYVFLLGDFSFSNAPGAGKPSENPPLICPFSGNNKILT